MTINKRIKSKIVKEFLEGKIKELTKLFKQSKKGDLCGFPLTIMIEQLEEWINTLKKNGKDCYF